MRNRAIWTTFVIAATLAFVMLVPWGGASLVGAQQQEGGVPSLGSALGPMALDIALKFGEQSDRLGVELGSKAAGAITNVMDSMHTVLLQFGAKVDVEVQYEPMDVPNGIHVWETLDEGFEAKRIRIDARVYYADDIEGKLPAATARKWMGLTLPKKGDALANVPVRFTFPKSLMPYLDLRAKEFDTTNPTWTKRTDQNGVATVYLYLIQDQPMGGERETVEGSLEVDVPMGQTKGFSINLFDMVMRPLGDEVAKPVSAVRTLRIEHHKATKFEGRVTLERKMTASWDSTAPLPDRPGASANVSANGTATWTETVTFDNVTLSDNGAGVGDYQYELVGRIQGTTVAKHRTVCGENNTPTVLTDTYTYNGVVQDRNEGAAPIEIHVDRKTKDQKYTVAIRTHGIVGSAFGIGRQAGGTISKQIQSCDGTKTSTEPFQEGASHVSSAASLPLGSTMSIYDHIRSGWKSFDPDATTLSGSDTWNEKPVTIADGNVKLTVTNTLTWSFKRVPADE
ncbi:MAG: hypothetical protein BWY85_01195 [Firmicutes bacterium ADurb.Bin506]|nr:MAG: hypothetical protein BWY85_01195 [Firmicutes bacterium ADurb.Bin506]